MSVGYWGRILQHTFIKISFLQVHSLSNVEDALNDFSDDLFDVKPPAFEKSKVNRKNLNDQRVFNNPIHTHDATKISNQFSSTPPPIITFRPSSLISESENLRQEMETDFLCLGLESKIIFDHYLVSVSLIQRENYAMPPFTMSFFMYSFIL